MTKEFIKNPIVDSLDNHSDQLEEVIRVTKSINNKFNKDKGIGHANALTEKSIESMEQLLYRCLLKVGDLSTSRSEVYNQLKDHYTRTYIKSPAMGKKLFIDHYFSLHKPYDKVKELIWKSIFTIVEFRENKFN